MSWLLLEHKILFLEKLIVKQKKKTFLQSTQRNHFVPNYIKKKAIFSIQKKNFLFKNKQYQYKKILQKKTLQLKKLCKIRKYAKKKNRKIVKQHFKKIIKKMVENYETIPYIFAFRKRMRLFSKISFKKKFLRTDRKRIDKVRELIRKKKYQGMILLTPHMIKYDRHDDLYKTQRASKRARYYHIHAEFSSFQKLEITKKDNNENTLDAQTQTYLKVIKYQRMQRAEEIKVKLQGIIENVIKKRYSKKVLMQLNFIKGINKKLSTPLTAKGLALIITQHISANLITNDEKNKQTNKINNNKHLSKQKTFKKKDQIIPARYKKNEYVLVKKVTRKSLKKTTNKIGLRIFSFKKFLKQKNAWNIRYKHLLKKYILTDKKIQIEKNLGTFLITLNICNDNLSLRQQLKLYMHLKNLETRIQEFTNEIDPHISHYNIKRKIAKIRELNTRIKKVPTPINETDEKKTIKRLKFRLFYETLHKKKSPYYPLRITKQSFYKQKIATTELLLKKQSKQLTKELVENVHQNFYKKKTYKKYTNFLQKKKMTNIYHFFFYENLYLENFLDDKIIKKKKIFLDKTINYNTMKEKLTCSKIIKYYLSTQKKIYNNFSAKKAIPTINYYDNDLTERCIYKKIEIISYFDIFLKKKYELNKKYNNRNTYGIFEKGIDTLMKTLKRKMKKHRKKLNNFRDVKKKIRQVKIRLNTAKFQQLFVSNKYKIKILIKKNCLNNIILKLFKQKKQKKKSKLDLKQNSIRGNKQNFLIQKQQQHDSKITKIKEHFKQFLVQYPLKHFFKERRAFLQERLHKKYSLNAIMLIGVKHSLLFTIFRICILSHGLRFNIRRGSAKRRRKIRQTFFKKKYEFISILKKFIKKKLKIRVPYRFTWLFFSKFMRRKLKNVKLKKKPKKIHKKRKSKKIFYTQKKFLPVKKIQITTAQISLKTLKNKKNVIPEFLQSVLNNLHFEKTKINKLISTTLDRNTLAYHILENNLRFFLFKLQTNTQFLKIDYNIKKGFSFFNFNFFYPETNPFAILHTNTFITFNTQMLKYTTIFNKFIKRLKNLNKNRGIRIFNHFALYKNYIFYIFKKVYKKKTHGNFYKIKLKKRLIRKRKRRSVIVKNKRIYKKIKMRGVAFYQTLKQRIEKFLKKSTTVNDLKYIQSLELTKELINIKKYKNIIKKKRKKRKTNRLTSAVMRAEIVHERIYVNEEKRKATAEKKIKRLIWKYNKLMREKLLRTEARKKKRKFRRLSKKRIKKYFEKMYTKYKKMRRRKIKLIKQKNHHIYKKATQHLYRKSKHGTRVLTNILYNYMF